MIWVNTHTRWRYSVDFLLKIMQFLTGTKETKTRSACLIFTRNDDDFIGLYDSFVFSMLFRRSCNLGLRSPTLWQVDPYPYICITLYDNAPQWRPNMRERRNDMGSDEKFAHDSCCFCFEKNREYANKGKMFVVLSQLEAAAISGNSYFHEFQFEKPLKIPLSNGEIYISDLSWDSVKGNCPPSRL